MSDTEESDIEESDMEVIDAGQNSKEIDDLSQVLFLYYLLFVSIYAYICLSLRTKQEFETSYSKYWLPVKKKTQSPAKTL